MPYPSLPLKLIVCLAVVGMNHSNAAADRQSIPPSWIGVDGLSQGDRVERSITVRAVQSAQLRFAGDFCRTRVTINHRPVAMIEPYCPTQTIDVTDAIQLGDNLIELIPIPIPGEPAVIAATLTIIQADGSQVIDATDENWKIKTNSGLVKAVTCRGRVPKELWGIDRREITIDPFENYEQWQQAKGGGGTSPRFFVAQDFEITQLRLAQPDEGSWISLASDEQGRLTIGREDKGLLRMTIATDGQSIANVQQIDIDLLECRGLVYRDGWLYACANNSKKLFRLKLDEGDAVTNLEELREFSGGVGHGRNDIAITGESLLLICGDSVDPLTTSFFDRTSPLRKRIASPFDREGSLLKMSLDGQKWELFCAGLRNPYGVAVNSVSHDAFTYDADNEFDLGMPWYRPTRILQLVAGGDYGYREASGQLPPRFSDQPDNALPLVDIGRGSPTAMMFGHDLKFPSPYRDALFALDWTYGRVLAIHLQPRGATYRVATELFLQGKPLNVTDVAAGRDGAMYLITGGRKTQSALYKVTPTTNRTSVDDADQRSGDEQFRSEITTLAQNHRQLIQRIQSDEFEKDHARIAMLLSLLNVADPAVRYAARTGLERLPASEWANVILDAPSERASLQSLMVVARLLDAALVPAIVRHLELASLADVPIDQRLVWLRVLELCAKSDSRTVLAQVSKLEARIAEGWQACQSPRLQVSIEGSNADYRRRAALILSALGSHQLPELAARDLLSSPVQEDQIAALMALRGQKQGFTAEARELQLQTLVAMPQMVGGEGLPTFHAWLERETLTTLTALEQARYAVLKAEQSKPDPLPPTRPFVRKWTLEDLGEIDNSFGQGNAQRGQIVFREALCSRCHRFGAKGPSIGPDLTFVAGRFSRKDILDSILNPSKSVAENYRSTTVETIDGKSLTGRLVIAGDFRSEKIRLIPDALRPGQIVELDKKMIESHRQSDLSPMPQGLVDSFTQDEIADLLAYLTGAARTLPAGQ